MSKFKKRFSRDRLAYFMVFCFGVALLTAIIANIQGYCLYEGNKAVRVVEIIIALGLIVLGIERLRNLTTRRRRGK